MVSFNIEDIRKDTPGCQHVLHFNNAGAALSPKIVVDAVKSHLDLESTIGGYEAAAVTLGEANKLYQLAGQLLHCEAREIAFLENATRAWDMAFYSLPFKQGDKILTSASEYASNYLSFLHLAKTKGLIIDVVNNDAVGQLDVIDLKNKIDHRVKLIAITHVPTQGGLINPVEEVGKIVKQYNIPFLLDATQSVGQMPIDVEAIGCDFLCATGRKYLRGPRGTGFLYVRKELINQLAPPFIDLHAASWVEDNSYILRPDALRFETWEQNIAAKIGLSVAIQYALDLGLSTIWGRIQKLAEQLRQGLLAIDSIKLHDLGEKQCGIVTFSSSKATPEAIKTYLASKKINVSLSRVEYARLDLGKRNIPVLVRASVHYYNTDHEIDIFLTKIRKFLS